VHGTSQVLLLIKFLVVTI